MKKLYITFIVALLLPLHQGGAFNKILAQVNKEIITLRDFEKYQKVFAMRNNMELTREQIIDKVIEEKLILQWAKEEGIEIPENILSESFSQLVTRYGGHDNFEKKVKEEGVTIAAIKDQIRDDLLIRRAIDRNVNSLIAISPKKVLEYYENNSDLFFSPKKYVCWIVQDASVELLKSLQQEIKVSGFSATREQRKDMFFRIESEEKALKKEVKESIKYMREKESVIREIDGEYYLIYLSKVIPEYQQFIQEVKDDISQRLWKEEFEKKFSEWIRKLKSEAVIKLYE